MDKIRRTIFFTVCIIGLLFNVCMSMERNWSWVESDDECGYFIDAENMYNHKVIGKIVDYSDVWVKVAYTQEGAKAEIDLFGLDGVDANVLKDGYGLYKLRLKYLTGEIEYLYLGFYDASGKLLANATENKSNIYRSSYLESIMYYASSKVTKGNEFSVYKNPSIPKTTYWEMKNKDGKKTRFYVPAYSIRKLGNKYEFVFYRVDYKSDNTIKERGVYYILYEGGDYYYLTRADVDEGYSSRIIDLSNDKEKREIVPSSYIERAIDYVKDYCEDENNYTFLHRFGLRGIIER